MKLPKISKNKDGKKDEESFLVLDLHENSVKALFISKGEEILTAKGASIKEVPKGEKLAYPLKTAIEECFAQSEGKTKNAIVGLGGPKVFGFIMIAKVKRSFPESKITESELEKVYERVRTASYKQAKNNWNAFNADDADFETLDLVVTSYQVDDAMVSDPIDEKGNYLQISVYCSYAEHNTYESYLKVMKKLKLNAMTVTTTLYPQVKLISEIEKNFIMVDVGKLYTDLAVVFGKNIIQTRSFEMGGDFFSTYLADQLGLEKHNASGKKEAYALGTLSADEMNGVGDHLYEAGKVWRIAFESILTSMSKIKSFPKKIYLSGGGANLSVIQELLYEEEWRTAIPFADDIEIEVASSGIWKNNLNDELKLLNGPRMFVPASLGIVKLELEDEDD